MGRKGKRKGGQKRGKRWRGGKKREEEKKVSGFAPSGKKFLALLPLRGEQEEKK